MQCKIKIAALASNSLVKLQTEVPTKIDATAGKRVMFTNEQQIQDLQLSPKLFIPKPNLGNFGTWYSRKHAKMQKKVQRCRKRLKEA